MKRFLLVMFVFFIGISLAAEETLSIDSLVISIKSEQQEALNEGNSEKLMEVRYKLERLAAFGEKEWLIDYYQAFNYYRMCNITYDDKEKQQKYVEMAREMIEKSIEQKDDFAESHILYSSILGLEISFKPYLGMKNGIKSGKEIELAHKLDPDNPRAYLVGGTSALNTPPIFGGGVDKAIEKLNRAVELFKEEEEDRGIYPDWGRDNVYIWLGIAFEKKDEKDKALEYYKKALEVNPDNGWAKSLIKERE